MSEKKVVTFGKVFWPSLVAALIISLIGSLIFWLVVGGIIGGLSEPTPPPVATNGVLHLTLEGDIAEKSTSQFDPTSMQMIGTVGLSDLLYGFEKAEKDANIKGIFLEIKDAQCGMASAKELREAINRFEKSGKFVVAYLSGEVITQKQYYIASAANDIYGFPSSMMEFVGLGGEMTFYKHTLDKLGVEMQVIRGRDNHFKSAVEPYFLDKMSDSSRLQVKRYMDNMWSEIRHDIATDRKISSSDLFSIAENMKIKRVGDAVNYKLIDGTKYRDEVIDILCKKAKIKTTAELEMLAFEKYSKRKFKDKQLAINANNSKIAVLIAEGDISVNGSGISSEKLCKTLREIRENKNLKALVIRINSPGGSALASDEIWREIQLVKKKMKVIVSMGDVAASGGYYIATPADYIFAEKSTITGSIGVFGVIPYTGKMLENHLGLSFDNISTNKHAVLSTNRKLTPEELQMTQDEVNVIYDEFLQRVADGRKMDKNKVHVLARGRVWTGTDALKNGLVDELGGLKHAIDYAAKKVKVKAENIVYYPRVKENPWDAVYELLEDEGMDERAIKTQKMPQEFLKYYNELLLLEELRGIQMRLPYKLEIR